MRQIKKFRFTPKLGWSSTRYDLFSICKRRYFYNYYTKYDVEFPVRAIEEMKNLVSIPLETGAVVHKVIEVLLNRLQKNANELNKERFFDFTRRDIEHRLQTKEFEEVFYRELPKVQMQDMYPKVLECLENLLASERYDWIIREAIESSDQWIIDPYGYGEARIGDLKVYCKVDFLFPVGEQYYIIDWKTGKPDLDKHRKQLIGYSAWASYHFEIEPHNVLPTIVYLHPNYEEVQETFNTFDLENLAIQIRAETEEMREYCRDIEQNIPLDKSEFPMVDNDRICEFCNFRGLCFPDQYPRVNPK